MKKILYITEKADAANPVMRQAFGLASQLKSELCVVTQENEKSVDREIREELMREAFREMNRAPGEASLEQIEPLGTEDFFRDLRMHITTFEPDLILLDTPAMIGNEPERADGWIQLADHELLPVIALQEPAHDVGRGDIVVLIPQIVDKEHITVDFVTDLSAELNADIHLLLISGTESDKKERDFQYLDGVASHLGIRDYSINTVFSDTLQQGLKNFLMRKHADMICINRDPEENGQVADTVKALITDQDYPVAW